MNREMLHSYLDGELSREDMAQVEAWLASDRHAARELAQLRTVDEALDGWTVSETGDGAAFADRVCAAVKPARGRLLAWAVPLALAAAALIAVSISLRGTSNENGASVLDTDDYMQYVWEADAETYGSLALDDLESQILAELETT